MKGDLVVAEINDAIVTDGDAVNVRSEVFERSSSVADRRAVNDPVLVPCFKRNGVMQFKLLEFVSELATKESPERGAMNEEVLVLGIKPSLSIEAESTARDEVVNM